MGRNRKHGSAARFVPAVKAALLCLLLGGSAIGYVYQKNQIIELGKQLGLRERKLGKLQEENVRLDKTLMTLKTGMALEERIRKLNLGLVQPQQSQMLTIPEVPAPVVPKSEALYADTPLPAGMQPGRVPGPLLRKDAALAHPANSGIALK